MTGVAASPPGSREPSPTVSPLRASIPNARMTADDVVFNAIERAARLGQRCPSNSDLAAAIGAKSPSGAVPVLARLVRRGALVVHSGNNARVVDIPSLGIGTAGLLPAQHWRERRGQSLAVHERPAEVEEQPRPLPRPRQAKPTPAFVPPVVRRDPCPRCGVRGDIGCKHTVRGW